MDNIIVFNPLREKELSEISKLELQKFKKRLKLQGIDFSYSKKVVDFVAKKSLAFDQGARLVRRNIQEFVEDKVAREIVEGKIRNNKISLDIKEEKIIAV